MEALWLDLEPDSALAFLHLPTAFQRSTAVLLCPPFGWQEMCSYRRRRRWAQALANAGYPSAMLDLPGTADSGGRPTDPQRLAAWTTAVSQSVRWIKETAGAERTAVIGIGLGGMVACRALAHGAPIDDLVLWAVPRNGRLMVRELEAYAGVVANRFAEPGRASRRPDDALELTGFRMTRETADELRRLDLTQLAFPASERRRVLLLGHDGLQPDERLREHLESFATVTVGDGEDYKVLMAIPQDARAPEATIRTTLGWLRQADAAPPPETTPMASRRAAVGRESTVHLYDGVRLTETLLSLEGGAFGILTERSDQIAAPVGAVMLNGGALRHTGPNRAWVEVARRWAARGVPTVRADFRGIGDADGDERQLLPNAALYAPERTAETIALLDHLNRLGVADRFVLGGLCSGAYWALHAALADARVAGAMIVNLYAFIWSDELVEERETSGALQALQGHAWQRLWRRDLTSAQVRTAVRSIRPGRIRAGAGRPVERAQKRAFEQALDQLRDQGTPLLFMLSQGEPFNGQLERQGIIARQDRWPNLAIEQIATRDHLFRSMTAQRQVHDALDRTLENVLVGLPGSLAARAQ